MKMMPTPAARRPATSLSTSCVAAGERFAVGSSKISTAGRNESARAMATLCRRPPDKSLTRTVTDGISIRNRGEHPLGRLIHRPAVDTESRSKRPPAQEDVLSDVEVAAQGKILVDHLDPGAARLGGGSEPHPRRTKDDLPGVRLERTRQDLHQRGFSRGIVPDESDDLASLEGQVNAAKRLHGAETLLDAAHLHKRDSHRACR